MTETYLANPELDCSKCINILSKLCLKFLQFRGNRFPRSRKSWWSLSDQTPSQSAPEQILAYRLGRSLWNRSDSTNRFDLFNSPRSPFVGENFLSNPKSRTPRARLVRVLTDQTIMDSGGDMNSVMEYWTSRHLFIIQRGKRERSESFLQSVTRSIYCTRFQGLSRIKSDIRCWIPGVDSCIRDSKRGNFDWNCSQLFIRWPSPLKYLAFAAFWAARWSNNYNHHFWNGSWDTLFALAKVSFIKTWRQTAFWIRTGSFESRISVIVFLFMNYDDLFQRITRSQISPTYWMFDMGCCAGVELLCSQARFNKMNTPGFTSQIVMIFVCGDPNESVHPFPAHVVHSGAWDLSFN
jgi:hypothetical protein